MAFLPCFKDKPCPTLHEPEARADKGGIWLYNPGMSHNGVSIAALFCVCLTVASAEDTTEGGLQHGAYIDLSYANDLDGSGRVPWRSKLTTNRLNQFDPNMGLAYVKKTPTDRLPWGFEFGVQGGYDTDGQVPSSGRLPGYSILRYLSRANVSYRAPWGKGLDLTAGLMNSFIGFESFYAKDNPNYTRTWIADYSPYFVMGIAARYPIDDKISIGLYLVNDYNYLAYVNAQPKYGAQVAWNFAPQWKMVQNVFLGPEQKDTAIRYWRAFSDTILQWSNEELMAALAYDAGTEQLADNASHLQTLWMGSALFTRWHVAGPWSVALRPEFYWDPNGLLTGSKQLIKSVTATLEYKVPVGPSSLTLRAEYRYDHSSGKQGGFFVPGTGAQLLMPSQNTFFFACLWAYDAP